MRGRVGHDWPVGVRFLAEEAIKDDYALPEAQRIALYTALAAAAERGIPLGEATRAFAADRSDSGRATVVFETIKPSTPQDTAVSTIASS